MADPTHAERLAWAAGIFEGEGTITVCRGVPRLALKMTDLEVVRRFADVVFFGSLYGPYQYGNRVDGSPRKSFLYWVAEGDDGYSVAVQVWPWLAARRRGQVREVFGATPDEVNHVKSQPCPWG